MRRLSLYYIKNKIRAPTLTSLKALHKSMFLSANIDTILRVLVLHDAGMCSLKHFGCMTLEAWLVLLLFTRLRVFDCCSSTSVSLTFYSERLQTPHFTLLLWHCSKLCSEGFYNIKSSPLDLNTFTRLITCLVYSKTKQDFPKS